MEAFSAPANENVLERLALLREEQAKLRQVIAGGPSAGGRPPSQPRPPRTLTRAHACARGPAGTFAWAEAPSRSSGPAVRAGKTRRHACARALSATCVRRRCTWTTCGKRAKSSNAKRANPLGYLASLRLRIAARL